MEKKRIKEIIDNAIIVLILFGVTLLVFSFAQSNYQKNVFTCGWANSNSTVNVTSTNHSTEAQTLNALENNYYIGESKSLYAQQCQNNFFNYTLGLIAAPLITLGLTLFMFFDACISIYKNKDKTEPPKSDNNGIGGQPQVAI